MAPSPLCPKVRDLIHTCLKGHGNSVANVSLLYIHNNKTKDGKHGSGKYQVME